MIEMELSTLLVAYFFLGAAVGSVATIVVIAGIHYVVK